MKQGALNLRMLELENVVQRYTSLIGVTSLAAGFAFSGMVELDLPSDPEHLSDTARYAFCTIFYISAACALVGSPW